MRKIIFCLTLLPLVIALLAGSCVPKVKIEAPEKPIRVEAKIEPIKIEAKIEVYIYQVAVSDVSYITGAAPPKTAPPTTSSDVEPEKKTPPPTENKESGAGNVLLRLLGIGVAYAETASDQQQLQKVLDSMRKRYAALSAYKADVSIGENRNGLVEERPSPKMSDAKYANLVRKTIAAEIADRRLLYQIRGRIDGITPEKVAAIYAKVWRDNAKPGHWIEVYVDKKWVWKQK